MIATGAGASWSGGSLAPFGGGTGVDFRADALPIVVHVTDALSHDAPDYAAEPSVTAATTANRTTPAAIAHAPPFSAR